ncbi:MAG TPA: DUF4232 domain-containing protein [Candidatus Eisenbacteria bacterium]|nr:DUF4232 domain-containing protein [Candidatus Eisenbacteria bacterium]
MRFCQAGDLTLRVGRTGVGLGSAYTSIIFTNRSSSTCQLQGVPRVRVLDAAGQVLSPPQAELDFNGPEPVELSPGVRDQGGIAPAVIGQAQLTIRRSSLECLPRPSATIVFVMPDSAGQLAADWPGSAFIGPGCSEGLGVSPFAGTSPATPQPTPSPDFAVAYVMPASVAIGQTLKYQVRLTNVSGRDIAFTSCPGYSEGIKGPTAYLRARYLLNCYPVGLFKAGETVTFAMELPIVSPPDFAGIRPGVNPVWWGIDWPYRTDFSGTGWITLTTPSASP